MLGMSYKEAWLESADCAIDPEKVSKDSMQGNTSFDATQLRPEGPAQSLRCLKDLELCSGNYFKVMN